MADNWQLKAVLSANAESMLKTLKAVNGATRTTRKYLMDVGSSAANLAGHVGLPLGLIGGALGAFSVAGIKSAVSSFAELGDQVVKSAQRIGVTTDEYQRLKYAAGQSGVSVEGLGSSMGRLNKGIAQAASGGNKDLAALFKRTGISMRDANGQLRSATDLLPEVAELFKNNTNAATQARMGNAIFGKSWQELAPLLQGGKDGIDELNARYQELGLSVDGKALKAGEAFGDQMEDLQHVAQSYGNTISAKLIPVFSPLIEKMTGWAVANRDLVTTKVSAFIGDIATELGKVDWSGVINGVGNFASGLKSVVDWVGGARNALIGLVIIMNAQTITALFGLVASLGRAGFAFAAMAAKAYIAGNTSMLSMMRVAAVALYTAGPVSALGVVLSGLGSAVKNMALAMVPSLKGVEFSIRGIGAAIMANPLGVIIALATAALLIYQNWDTLKGWFSSFFDWIGDKFSSIVGWASDLAKSVASIFGGSDGMDYKTVVGTTIASPAAAGAAAPAPLVGNSQQQVGGKFTFDFQNAPPGMRVAGIETKGKTDVDMNVGTRGYAMD